MGLGRVLKTILFLMTAVTMKYGFSMSLEPFSASVVDFSIEAAVPSAARSEDDRTITAIGFSSLTTFPWRI